MKQPIRSLKKLVKKYPRKSAMLLLFVVVLSVAGVVLIVKNSNQQKVTPNTTVTYSTDTPDEDKPGDDFKWWGGRNDPKYIRIPSIKAEGYIQNVGVDQKKQIAVPNNIHMAGWFVDSARPGNKGLSIIDGHVTGRVNDGIFKNLGNLKQGDSYSVEMGDGSIKNYKVIKIVSVATKDSASVLFSQSSKVKSQLNLITCGGNFNQKTQQYDKRIIVASELVS